MTVSEINSIIRVDKQFEDEQMSANQTLKETAREIMNLPESPKDNWLGLLKSKIAPLTLKLDTTGKLSRNEIYQLWVYCAAAERLGLEVPTESDLQPWLKGFKPSSLMH